MWKHWWHNVMKDLILTYADQASHLSWKAELISSYFMVEFLRQLVSQLMIMLIGSCSLQPVIHGTSYQDTPSDLLQNPYLWTVVRLKVATISLSCSSKRPAVFCLRDSSVGWVRGVDHLVCLRSYQPFSLRWGLHEKDQRYSAPVQSQIFDTAPLCSAISSSSAKPITPGSGLSSYPCLFCFLLVALNLLPTE